MDGNWRIIIPGCYSEACFTFYPQVSSGTGPHCPQQETLKYVSLIFFLFSVSLPIPLLCFLGLHPRWASCLWIGVSESVSAINLKMFGLGNKLLLVFLLEVKEFFLKSYFGKDLKYLNILTILVCLNHIHVQFNFLLFIS